MKSQLSRRLHLTNAVILGCIFFLPFCKTSSNEKNIHGFFCDSCESEIIEKIFDIDTIKIFYKDYSDLNNIKDAVIPIENSYLKSIDANKYITDSSLTKHIGENSIKAYNKARDQDSTLSPKYFKDLSKAFYSASQITQFTKDSKIRKFIRISKPIFGDGMNYVLVEVDYNCNGLCGQGYTYLLQKTEQGWVLYKKIIRWVS